MIMKIQSVSSDSISSSHSKQAVVAMDLAVPLAVKQGWNLLKWRAGGRYEFLSADKQQQVLKMLQ